MSWEEGEGWRRGAARRGTFSSPLARRRAKLDCRGVGGVIRQAASTGCGRAFSASKAGRHLAGAVALPPSRRPPSCSPPYSFPRSTSQDGSASAGSAPALPRPALDLALSLLVPPEAHSRTRPSRGANHPAPRPAVILPLLPTPEELNTKQQVRVLIEKLIRTVEPKSRLLAFGSTVRPSNLPARAALRARPD